MRGPFSCESCCPASEMIRCADRVAKAGPYEDRVGVVVAFAVIGLLASVCMLDHAPKFKGSRECEEYDCFGCCSLIATMIVVGVALPVYLDFTEVYGEPAEEDPDWKNELNRTRKGVLGSCVAVGVVAIVLTYSAFYGGVHDKGPSSARYILYSEDGVKIPEKYLVIALTAALFVALVVSSRMLAVMHEHQCFVSGAGFETTLSYYCPEE